MKKSEPQQSQPLASLQADLRRQAKELDAREEYLEERIRLLNSGPVDLKVLEETVRVKQAQLAAIKTDIEREESKGKERLKALDDAINEKERELRDLTQLVKTVGDAVKQQKQEIIEWNDARKNVERDVDERTKYRNEQEKIINEMIDEGNATLRGINYEIQAANDKKDATNQEIAEVEMKKTDVAYQLVQLEDRYNQDKFNYEQELEDLKSQVEEERRYIGTLKAEASKVKADTDEKLKTLDIREQELQAQQGAIVKERQALDQEKRRWISTKSLYGIK